jgi:uncharacterized lipoprotein
MKKMFMLVAIAAVVMLSGCGVQEQERAQKDQESSQYGLNRVATVYASNGQVIARYEGRFDIDSNTDGNGGTTGTKVKFDLNGKRTIIYVGGGTVVVDEK